jgi:ferritin-like protein
MKSECSGYDAIEAVKGAIQNFMDGRFYRNVELKANHFDCIIHNRINSLEVQIPEPFKTLFLELFDVQKSQIPQKKLV